MPIKLDDDAGGERAERLANGEYNGRVSRVMCRSNQGGPLKTHAGDRKIRLIFKDDAGREGMYEAMVEGKAAWKMARFLKNAGFTDDDLTEEGVTEYTDFLDQKTADRLMLGCSCLLRVTTRKSDDGKEYADIEILGPAKVEAEAPAATKKAAPRADVPF